MIQDRQADEALIDSIKAFHAPPPPLKRGVKRGAFALAACVVMSLAATSAQAQETTDICGRTPLIRDWILSETPAEDECGSVLVSEMAGIRRRINFPGNNNLSLKSGDFDGLAQVRIIDLARENLKELPPGIFSEMPALQEILLENNALEALPDGVFAGLSKLVGLRLEGNPGADFRFTVRFEPERLEKDFDAAPVRLVLREGAPRPITVPLSVTGGELMASSLTFAVGSTQTAGVTVIKGSGVFRMSQGEPMLGTAVLGLSTYQGFEIVRGPPLRAGGIRVKARVFLEGALE